MRSLVAVGACAVLTATMSGCSSASVASPCHSRVVDGEVPEWARTGFSPGATVPHVLGEGQRIVAVIFAGTLVAAQGPEPVNKVLFVPREPLRGPSPLRIAARLDGMGEVVRRDRLDGPGPGSLDLPVAGCWRMTLTWADQSDSIDLEYVPSPTDRPSGGGEGETS